MKTRKGYTRDALKIMYQRYYAGRPDRIADLEVARANDEVARQLYAMRKRARLTQAQLAKRVGMTEQVIRELEDADYEGNTLGMLQRIASVLKKRVEVHVVADRA